MAAVVNGNKVYCMLALGRVEKKYERMVKMRVNSLILDIQYCKKQARVAQNAVSET